MIVRLHCGACRAHQAGRCQAQLGGTPWYSTWASVPPLAVPRQLV